MIITIFNKNNGKIDRTIYCVDDHIPLNYDSLTEDYIEGEYAGNKYYIENKTPVLIPDAPNTYSKFNYDTKQWFDPRTPEIQWTLVKNRRNNLLLSSDWTQMPDVAIATKSDWATYRQALRDITTQADPFNIVWPIPPGG